MISRIKDIGWLFKRLRAMPIEEIKYRLKSEIKKRYWKLFNVKHFPTSVKLDKKKVRYKDLNFDNITLNREEKERIVEEANQYLDHRWLFFGLQGLKEESINWHKDPISGTSAPLQFSFDINHRDEDLVGSIKNIWEKSRHHHLTVLAVAYKITGKEKYAKEVVDQITSWMKQNPYLKGVNWTHPLEHGIRLISWVWCERLLTGSKYYEHLFSQERKFWTYVYQHQKFILETYSHGSSANNHLIGEMAGLFVASSAWPYYPESDEWCDFAKSMLEEEILRQTYESGINKELAFSYQVFVIEFFLLAALEGKYLDKEFSNDYMELLRKMIEVIPLMTDKEGNLPRYGDGDEGRAIQLQPISYRRDHWIYEVGKDLLNANVPTPEIKTMAALILGNALNEKKNYNLPKKSVGFKDAGIYILSENRGKEDEVFVMVDAGPLGYLSIAAHGHADALSYTMSVGGIPIIIDPGTYCYHTEEEWRYYFRGTQAHNTITIDGKDQSVQDGAFLWTNKAKTVVGDWKPEKNILRASHDGYERLGVIHEREFKLQSNELILLDKLKGNSLHKVENSLHFAPRCQVWLKDHFCHVQANNIELIIKIDDQLSANLYKGKEQKGWYSHGFGVKEPTTTLVMEGDLYLQVTIETKINIHIN